MQFKVMTYNLLYAFHERRGRAMIYHEGRARAAYSVIREQSPDILGLTESIFGTNSNRFMRSDYEGVLGDDYQLHYACYPNEWGCCLLSRFQIIQAERVSLGRNAHNVQLSALRARLKVGQTEVQVDVVHPSPHVTEDQRLQSLQPLIDTMQRPHLMLGDFNALSDEDPYDRETMIEQMSPYLKDPGPLADKMLDRKVIATLRAAGLRDTLPPARRTHTLPTTLPRPHATEGARLRIDYILATEEFSVVDSEVIKTPPTELASDHYPLVATLEI